MTIFVQYNQCVSLDAWQQTSLQCLVYQVSSVKIEVLKYLEPTLLSWIVVKKQFCRTAVDCYTSQWRHNGLLTFLCNEHVLDDSGRLVGTLYDGVVAYTTRVRRCHAYRLLASALARCLCLMPGVTYILPLTRHRRITHSPRAVNHCWEFDPCTIRVALCV